MHLDPARWFVAAFAFLSAMIYAVTNLAVQGVRFTHWTLATSLSAPLFHLGGSPINLLTIVRILLFLSIVYAVIRYSIAERRRQAGIEQEIQNARELQQVLVPETLPALPGFTLTSAYRPAQEVGGDFFQIIPLPGGSTLIVLGDVSGKGLKAAMAVSLIVGAIRSSAETTASPAEILAALNRRLHGRLNGGFATCLALRLDPDGNCILPAPVTPRPSSMSSELQLPGALPLGLDARSHLQRIGDPPSTPATTFPSTPTAYSKPAAHPANSMASTACRPYSPPSPTPHKPRKPPSLSARTTTSPS